MTTETAYERTREVLDRRWGTALVTFVSAAAAAFSFCAFLPDVYKATATLLVQPPATEHSGGAWDADLRLQLLRQKVLSRARLEQVIERFDLYPAMRRGGGPLDLAADRMRREIAIEPTGSAGGGTAAAFRVSYWGHDPMTVSLVANALANAFIEEDAGTRRQQVSGAVAALRSQLADAKGRLDLQEQRIAEFKRRFGGELPQQAETNLVTLERLNSQLRMVLDNRSRSLERRAALQQRQLEAARAPGERADSPSLRVERLRARLAELRRSYGDKYPDVIHVGAELAAAEAALAQAPPEPQPPDPIAGQLEQLAAETRRFETEERELREQLARYQRRLENAPTREQEFLELSRDYATTRTLYESLLKRSEEAQLEASPAEAGPRGTFRLLDQAVIPRLPVGPNRPGLALAGLLLGLVLAALVVVAVEQLDDSLHSPEEVRAFAGVPVLISVPRVGWSGWKGRGRRLLLLAPAVLCIGVAAELARRLALLDTPLASLLARGRL